MRFRQFYLLLGRGSCLCFSPVAPFFQFIPGYLLPSCLLPGCWLTATLFLPFASTLIDKAIANRETRLSAR